MVEKKEIPETTENKLDRILIYLERMDKRDRLRMVGGFFRGLIAIIPVLLLLASAWYAFTNWDEILRELTRASANAVQEASKNSADSLRVQFEGLLGQ